MKTINDIEPQENPELSSEAEHGTRIRSAFLRFSVDADVIYLGARLIYQNLAREIHGRTVTDIGCGLGVGTALLSQKNEVHGCDKVLLNVLFARSLYAWLPFEQWDISICSCNKAHTVVCVDVLEHIQDDKSAMRNLLHSAERELWLTTPNRLLQAPQPNGKPVLASHVREYIQEEVLELIGDHKVLMYRWMDFVRVDDMSDLSILTFRIMK